MFAGPNGSGKSTIKSKIEKLDPKWLGVYINPDEIESEIEKNGLIDLSRFNVTADRSTIIRFLKRAPQLIQNDLVSEVNKLDFNANGLSFRTVSVNSYFVSALADFLHLSMVASNTSFSFETVMSHRNKINLLRTARSKGFRNYLYFVGTEDPEINISRVATRVREGGHDVPKDRIVDRYYRTMENLTAAIRETSRSYIYDNSGSEAKLVAEVTDGKSIEIKNSNVPLWLRKYLLDKSVKES